MTVAAPRAPHTVRGPRSRSAALALGLVAAVALLVVAVGVSVAVGAKAVPLGDVWAALVRPDDGYASAVVASRIPRTQLGLLVGAALAVAGALIQGLTRNPLGDPGLLGVNAGASVSVVLVTAVVGVGAGPSVWAAVPGAAVAAAGPIAFVGLAVPHMVRAVTGSDHRWLLPYCAVLGPVLLLASDVAGRVVARPGELGVGSVTAFVGAPFLIAAVRRGRAGL